MFPICFALQLVLIWRVQGSAHSLHGNQELKNTTQPVIQHSIFPKSNGEALSTFADGEGFPWPSCTNGTNKTLCPGLFDHLLHYCGKRSREMTSIDPSSNPTYRKKIVLNLLPGTHVVACENFRIPLTCREDLTIEGSSASTTTLLGTVQVGGSSDPATYSKFTRHLLNIRFEHGGKLRLQDLTFRMSRTDLEDEQDPADISLIHVSRNADLTVVRCNFPDLRCSEREQAIEVFVVNFAKVIITDCAFSRHPFPRLNQLNDILINASVSLKWVLLIEAGRRVPLQEKTVLGISRCTFTVHTDGKYCLDDNDGYDP